MTDLVYLPAHRLAQAIREREVTAVEVLEAHLCQIARHNPRLNAIITLDEASARQRAREADRALARGELWGPLHGLPVTVKDVFETAGMRTTAGYPPLATYVPQRDATVVACLRQAGAIILGKTNVPLLGRGEHTDNPIFGRTNNPWKLECTPGGSSGGSAAAVAAGLSPLDIGSDLGGSIRMPAHFCGIFGLKLTGGRELGKGQIASARPARLPEGWEALREVSSVGPLARSVTDLRLALSVIAGPELAGAQPPPEAQARRPLRQRRIAWTDDLGGFPLSADVRAAMQGLACKLAEAGCRVERHTSAGFDYDEAWEVAAECVSAIDTLLQPKLTRLYRKARSLIPTAWVAGGPLVRGLVKGAGLNPRRMAGAFERRAAIIDSIERFLGDWDAWLCPVFPQAAYTHRKSSVPLEVAGQKLTPLIAAVACNVVFNMTGHPVAVVPIGLSAEGLPIGVQIVGRRWHEMELLDVAEQVAEVTGGYRRPPGY